MDDVTQFGTVRCRRLEVVDGDGVVRLLLHCEAEDDSAVFEVHTPKQNGSLYVYADENGLGVQAWSRGNAAVTASVGLDGVSTVEVSDPRTMKVLFEADTRS